MYIQRPVKSSRLTEFFTDGYGILSIAFSFILMPYYVLYVIYADDKKLEANKGVLGALYEDLRIDSRSSMAYCLVFVLRRIFLVLICLFVSNIPSIQIIMLMILNLGVFIYIGII